tara:strand:+ start:233 stop:700 length:468 start_codon:yes stop_codon:yes gene_type:complete
MPRLGPFKLVAAFVTILSGLASSGTARQLECSYEYGTHKEFRTISETQDGSGELEWTFRHVYGKYGKKMWRGNATPSMTETKGRQNYISMSPNLYYWGTGIFKHLIYINFEKPKFYEVISFGPAFKGLEITSSKIDDNDRMLQLPTNVWDCRLLD